MHLGFRALAIGGLAVVFAQASANAQYSDRPFGNGNEWYYRSQQAARGEISKRDLHQWMYEDQNPSHPRARIPAPQPIVQPYPPYPYRYSGDPRAIVVTPYGNYRLVPADQNGSGGRPRGAMGQRRR